MQICQESNKSELFNESNRLDIKFSRDIFSLYVFFLFHPNLWLTLRCLVSIPGACGLSDENLNKYQRYFVNVYTMKFFPGHITSLFDEFIHLVAFSWNGSIKIMGNAQNSERKSPPNAFQERVNRHEPKMYTVYIAISDTSARSPLHIPRLS